MRTLAAFLIVLCAFTGVSADNQNETVLVGRVSNETTGAPLTGAVVTIQELKVSRAADAQGRFVFRIPLLKETPSSIHVQASAEGFEPESLTVSLVPATVTLNFALALRFQEEITVKAQELEPAPEAPQPAPQLPRTITTEIGDSGLEGILEDRHPWSGRFRFRAGLESRYDDNLFQYSEQSLERFNPARSKYEGLSSTDDVIYAVPIRFDYRLKYGWKTRFTLVADPQFHARNTIRNYQIYYANVNQKLPKDFEFNFRYLLIPHYFYRNLASPPNQLRTYAKASHDLNAFQFTVDKDLNKRLTAQFTAQYFTKNYNREFSYQDSRTRSAGIELTGRIARDFRLQGGAAYESSRAEGRNDPRFNYDNTYGWASYYVTPRFDPAKWLTLTATITYGPKVFFSELPEDVNHFGRRDRMWTEEVSSSIDITGDLELRLKYEHTSKTSTRSGEELDFPSYTENRFSAAVYYDF